MGASISASVLLMNIQGWFLLGLTGLISWSLIDWSLQGTLQRLLQHHNSKPHASLEPSTCLQCVHSISTCGVTSWWYLFIHPALNLGLDISILLPCGAQSRIPVLLHSGQLSPLSVCTSMELKTQLCSFLGIRVMVLACTDLPFGQHLFVFFTWRLLMPESSHPKHVQLKLQNFVLIPIKFHPVSFCPLVLPMENVLTLGFLSPNNLL